MRSKALNRAFNRALIDLEYRHALLCSTRSTLRGDGVPESEIRLLENAAPADIRELAAALEQMHTTSFH